jgi:short-subunit dehydrogenase
VTLKEKYGDWALVTGASAGIGRAFARHLAECGLQVILVARRKERLEEVANDLESRYAVRTLPVPVDLTDHDFLLQLTAQVGGRQVGLLVNNAGFGSTGLYSNNDADREARMVRLHCLAPVMLTHHFIPAMVQRKKGGVIFVGSIVGAAPVPYIATYSASKVFNMFMGSALWYEMKEHNVDVLALAPGGTRTEFSDNISRMTSPIAAEPEQVVRTAMKALGRKPYVTHGVHNKVWGKIVRYFPMKMSLRINGWFVKQTTNFHKK